MRTLKVSIIHIALFLLLFSIGHVKAEAALHPWFGVDDFRDAYNSAVVKFNTSYPDYRLPKLRSFSKYREGDYYVARFEAPYSKALMAIKTQPNGRIKSIIVSKRIQGFTVRAGKRIPQEYVEFYQLGILLLTVLGFPIEDDVCNMSLQGTLKKMLEKDVIGENTEFLYNPLLGMIYCLDMRVDEGIAYFAIVNRRDYWEKD